MINNDQIIAYIRTFVPIFVGFVLTWLARSLGIVIDETTTTEIVITLQGFVTSAYYVVVTFLATKFPAVGWLLGYPTSPKYGASV